MKHRGPEHIVTVLVAGVPNNEATAEREDEKAFPDGVLKLLANPLAAEYRGFDPKKNKVNGGVFDAAWYKVLADLYQDYGLSREQIEQRERRRQARRRLIVASVSGVIAVVMAVLAAVAVWQCGVAVLNKEEALLQRKAAVDNEERAREQEKIAKQNEAEAILQRDLALSRQLSSEAQRLKTVDEQWTTAVLLGIESLHQTASPEAHAVLWELAAAGAKLVSRLVTKSGSVGVGAMEFSPDSRTLAVGADDAVVLLQARGGRELRRMPFPELARSIVFDRTGKQLLVQSEDSIRLFDTVTGRETARLDDGAGRQVFGVSPDGLIGAMASGHGVRVVELFSQRPIFAVQHDHPVTKIHVGPGGKQVALESGKRLTVIHTATGHRVDLPERPAAIGAVSFTADGAFVILSSSGHADESVVFDTASGAKQDQLPPSARTAPDEVPGTLEVVHRTSREPVQAIRASHDGELLIAGTGDRHEHTTVFQMKSGRRLARLVNAGQMVSHSKLSADGTLVARAANQFLAVFEAHRGRSIVRLSEPGRLTRLAFSPDGTAAAGAFDESRIIVVESDTGRRLGSPHNCDRPRALALGTRGRLLVVGCYDGRLRVVDVARDRIVGEISYRSGAPIVLSRDGRFFFSVGDKGAAVFEATNGRTVKIVGGDSVSAVALSPDAKHVATGGGNGASLVDVVGGREPIKLRPGELIEGLAFSPDGKRVAIGGRSRLVTIHEIDTGRVVTTVDHKEEEKGVLRVRALAFSASGQLLATVVSDPTIHPPGSDSTVRVFHAWLGQELIRIPLRDNPHFLRFSADDAYLELAVGIRNIRLERYPLKAEDMAREACSWVGRNFTELEWSRYLGQLPYRATCTGLNRATGP